MVDVKQPEIAIYVADDESAPYTTGTRDDKSTYSGWRVIKHESQMPVTFVDDEYAKATVESNNHMNHIDQLCGSWIDVDNVLPSNESMQQLINALEWDSPVRVDHSGKVMLFVSGITMSNNQYNTIDKLRKDGWRIGVIYDEDNTICDNKQALAMDGVPMYSKSTYMTKDAMNYLMRELAFG